VTRGSRAKNNL